jgi:hypothetical protein
LYAQKGSRQVMPGDCGAGGDAEILGAVGRVLRRALGRASQKFSMVPRGLGTRFDLLPVVPAHVADPELARARAGETEGLRRPIVTTKSSSATPFPTRGLSGGATGSGPLTSRRSTAPSKLVGSAGVTMSWLRNAPPSAFDPLFGPPTPSGGSPQGFTGFPSWPVSVKWKLAPSPPLM